MSCTLIRFKHYPVTKFEFTGLLETMAESIQHGKKAISQKFKKIVHLLIYFSTCPVCAEMEHFFPLELGNYSFHKYLQSHK